ncbi:ATP-dependent DNA helicase [Acidaminobacter sp.]|uniref:ATP-dependent DNA helicase n=1 Tax=Acidaminobacter sp. TaxID=1872102 RepID=UPI002560FBF3|nr:ATP-dependent DNA helicase [Acidaminobacter sp.]MDK9710457.1 ATP-dependent DNA helicase [Acidaminobacter sp.]
MSNAAVIKVSVRELVEFTLRSGDLDTSFKSSIRAQEGTRLHQKVQRSRDADYQAEVPLAVNLTRDGIELRLEGRADGIFEENGTTFVEEIKSTLTPLDKLREDDRPLHWAQAQCYAYIISKETLYHGSLKLGIRLTYIHAETEEILQFDKPMTSQALSDFMEDLIQRYLKWIKWQRDWRLLRNASAAASVFPYPAYRTGQRELAVRIYKTILSGGRMFVQAPTGTGKTMSTLFPTIKALGLNHADKLFYLTARTTTQAVCADALSLLSSGGLRLKSVVLTAKEKICFLDKPSCKPEDCLYAKGHYDRINDALMEALEGHDILSRESISDIAARHRVCPFEMALDLTLWADLVLCDYNYVFDPRVSLKRFFDVDLGASYVFLVDEAHHLVDRAREMYSASLQKTAVMDLKKRLKKPAPTVSRAMDKINTQLVALKKEAADRRYTTYEDMPEPLLASLRRFEEAAQKFLAKSEKSSIDPELKDELLDFYFDVLGFLRISELYGPDFITYTESWKNELQIKLFCLHPKRLLNDALSKGKAAVLFSATLHPLPYFRDVSGGSREDLCLRLPSPFDQSHLGLYVYSALSTRYKDRLQTTASLAELIHTVASAGRPGHYLVFFPSYEYLRLVLSDFQALLQDISACTDPDAGLTVDVQQQTMDDAQRESFIKSFDILPRQSRVVFAVLGGLFSEGIDLTGDRLSGVIVVGVGLPQLHYENDLLKDFYEVNTGDGYGFAYQFPGMNKVLQAAGRVIRTETDRGVVLLVDDRFTHSRYRKLFPPEWSHAVTLHSPEALAGALKTFWSNG